MATLSKNNLFPPEVVSNLTNLVRGHSTIAKLSAQSPIAFNGQTEFTFSLDKEVDIVAENGAKSLGGATVSAITVRPIKIEYGARVSDEFMYASEEAQLPILQAFAEAFATKVAKGLDLMALHGVNPRTGQASDVIGTNAFDKAVTSKIEFDAATADDNLDSAIQLVTAEERTNTGLALSPEFATAMSKIKVNGVSQYPEFRFGGNPATFAGIATDVNNTVSGAQSKTRAVVGDFATAFKWGVSKDIPLEVIEFGNPDNDQVAGDLKGHNQVYLRSEMYIGWGILDPKAFALVTDEA